MFRKVSFRFPTIKVDKIYVELDVGFCKPIYQLFIDGTFHNSYADIEALEHEIQFISFSKLSEVNKDDV